MEGSMKTSAHNGCRDVDEVPAQMVSLHTRVHCIIESPASCRSMPPVRVGRLTYNGYTLLEVALTDHAVMGRTTL